MRRRGLGLVTAIVLLVLIATVAMLMLSLATTSSKRATDDYLRIQAEMLARSATDFAVMRVQGFDRSSGTEDDPNDDKCLENLDIKADPFDINVTINYLFDGKPTNCDDKYVLYNNADLDDDLNGTIILDVVVTQQMPADPAEWSSEPIRIHKRTIQKP